MDETTVGHRRRKHRYGMRPGKGLGYWLHVLLGTDQLEQAIHDHLAHHSTEEDVVADIACAASENRLQIKGASGKARQRKGNILLLENEIHQGLGHRRYRKFV
jgi:hypothetical protein